MTTYRSRIVVAVAAAALGGVACDEGLDPTDFEPVLEVRLSPADTTVEHPDSFRYRVQLFDDEGELIDDGLDRPRNFDATDQSVINVSDGGFVWTEAAGATIVTAAVGGATGEASLTVTDDLADPPMDPTPDPPEPM
jgi:hypothetical protein